MELAEAGAQSADADRHESALLAVEGVSMRFGGVTALEDVSFDVASGAICGLIGPNGAGKTTLFNCISRLYVPNAGSIHFDRRPLASFSRHEIAALGIARTFQNVALFSTMSTRDNVRVGAHALARGGFLANALALPLSRREERRLAERADALIEEFRLASVADRAVGELPFGVRKRVELARALAIGPKLAADNRPGSRSRPSGRGPRRSRRCGRRRPRPTQERRGRRRRRLRWSGRGGWRRGIPCLRLRTFRGTLRPIIAGSRRARRAASRAASPTRRARPCARRRLRRSGLSAAARARRRRSCRGRRRG